MSTSVAWHPWIKGRTAAGLGRVDKMISDGKKLPCWAPRSAWTINMGVSPKHVHSWPLRIINVPLTSLWRLSSHAENWISILVVVHIIAGGGIVVVCQSWYQSFIVNKQVTRNRVFIFKNFTISITSIKLKEAQKSSKKCIIIHNSPECNFDINESSEHNDLSFHHARWPWVAGKIHHQWLLTVMHWRWMLCVSFWSQQVRSVGI